MTDLLRARGGAIKDLGYYEYDPSVTLIGSTRKKNQKIFMAIQSLAYLIAYTPGGT